MSLKDLNEVISELKLLSNGQVTKLPPPNDELLCEYESKIGFKFSDEYRLFLKEASNVFYGTKDPLVVTKDMNARGELIIAIDESRKVGIPNAWLPICEDNGDYFCIVPGGQIRYWSPDGGTDESWPNLASWIKDVWIAGS